MTMPPPPPDRMHLQYQPAPPPQPGPQQMGPGGAYGPAQYSPEQPLPGQMPMGMSMTKPGTITGIQVILYIFLAISAVGNVFSVMSMVEFFNPFSLIGLAFAVYSAIQSLASGVQISRGKRWAWIWSLISAILGLVLAMVGIVWGIWWFDNGGWITFTISMVLAALYGPLLGLLCSKSARQWILMHRIQRGEVQMPGMAMGGMPGMGQQAPQQGPQRPDTRPGAATFMLVVLGLMMALCAWIIYGTVRVLMMLHGAVGINFTDPAAFHGARIPMLAGISAFLVLVSALISAIGVHKGKFGARVYTLIWTPVLILTAGFVALSNIREFLVYADILPPPSRTSWTISIVVDLVLVALILTAFIAALTPGVKAWTPGKPATALIMMVPMGQPQGPYQQGGYPQQQPQHGQPQPPYPPQY
jgi:hypothetical protein